MKLSKIAILALRGTGKGTKEKIAAQMNVSLNAVYRWINENEANGDLTKASAVQIISEETGLTDGQILEEADVEEHQS